jgi:hypothetical protein
MTKGTKRLICKKTAFTRDACSDLAFAQNGFREEPIFTMGGTKAMDASAIISAVRGVTGKWAKQRKAEEREAGATARRRDAFNRSRRVTVKDAAYEGMETAYLAASTDGKYPAHARQIFYPARGPIEKRTGRTLDDQYFCQTLLPDYLAEHPDETADWDVVFDARGHFTEPHTDVIVPLGTLDVRGYLAGVEAYDADGDLKISVAGRAFPTCGPRHRFSAILFIEKEGFMPLFRAVKLAERYDVAVMSTKGMSVTASRLLVDRLCAAHDIPLLVLRDFDKSGFSIVGTLQRSTRRYSFQNKIKVIDLGLRLNDVKEWNLQPEDVAYGKSDPHRNLRENGATAEEIAFLCDDKRSTWRHYVGRRVELNAFTSGNLIAWIESKLQQYGIKKLVPDAATLETAFRRAAANDMVQRRVEEIVRQARAEADRLKAPKSLEHLVEARLKAEPALPWDRAIADLVNNDTDRS